MDKPSTADLLDVQDLKMYFPIFRGLLRKKVAEVKAVDGVSFRLRPGETLGLVGESGCGKTTIGRCVLRLYRPTAGRILFEGQDLASMGDREMRSVRRRMTLIFQDPYSSLNPRQTAESIVGEPLRIHKLVANRTEYKEQVADLLEAVGLDPGMGGRFPHEFSGGQRQRIGIARALASGPSLIVCDEPISALDVSIQAQIINLLQELQEGRGRGQLAYIFIAHDLSVVKHISNRIAVAYLGRIVELCAPEELYEYPLHPYTRALLSAIPVVDPFVEETRERIVIGGEPPSPVNPPAGCSFHVRCSQAMPECSRSVPSLTDVGPNHQVACFLYNDEQRKDQRDDHVA
jgi:peptide/nickel transport system ATP-binding protein